MPCLDNTNYPSLSVDQNNYLKSIRDTLEANGCNLTFKQDEYLVELFLPSLHGYKNEQEFIAGVNELYRYFNFGLSGSSTWEKKW